MRRSDRRREPLSGTGRTGFCWRERCGWTPGRAMAPSPRVGGCQRGRSAGRGAEGALWRELWEETGSRAFVLEAAFTEPLSFSFPPEMAARLGFAGQETRMFLLHYTGWTPLAPADSEIDALEFVRGEELLWRTAHRESRDPFLKNRRRMSQKSPPL